MADRHEAGIHAGSLAFVYDGSGHGCLL
jgi:hypothetical protein